MNDFFKKCNVKSGINILCGESNSGKTLLMCHIISDILHNTEREVLMFDNERCVTTDIVENIFLNDRRTSFFKLKSRDDIINERLNAIINGDIKENNSAPKVNDKQRLKRCTVFSIKDDFNIDDMLDVINRYINPFVFLFGNLQRYYNAGITLGDTEGDTEVEVGAIVKMGQRFFKYLFAICSEKNIVFWIETHMAKLLQGGVGYTLPIGGNTLMHSANSVSKVNYDRDNKQFYIDIMKSRLDIKERIKMDCKFDFNK